MEVNKLNSKQKIYESKFKPSARGFDVLVKGRILGDNETPQEMVERVVKYLIQIEDKFNTSEEEKVSLANEFGNMMDCRCCVMSTPIITNAGRYLNKPLSACTVPIVDLAKDDLKKIKKIIFDIHQDGMGTGFSLDEVADPVKVLRKLNKFSIQSAKTGKEDRPVGNMATLSVYHDKIFEFINIKVDSDRNSEDWKFNLSVDCDSNFFDAIEKRGDIALHDGTKVSASKILDQIVFASHSCADPGMVFLERMEKDNPTPGVGHYTSTAPCAEVGLTQGESCQFGYLNLASFVMNDGEIDLEKVKRASHVMTRMLDNALEISMQNFPDGVSKQIMSRKRKIGIGVCGLADLFVKMKIMYDSEEARKIALDLVTLVNFESKLASYELAKKRGSFEAMNLELKNRHLDNPSFIEEKYGKLETEHVSSDDWVALAKKIRQTKLMRNASTVALPPTGRSALIIDASTGIEPVFSKEDYIDLHKTLQNEHHDYIQAAKHVSPKGHLMMAAEMQKGVDEAISKTINLSETTSVEEMRNIYIETWKNGLKGVSVYREGTKIFQPKKLS